MSAWAVFAVGLCVNVGLLLAHQETAAEASILLTAALCFALQRPASKSK